MYFQKRRWFIKNWRAKVLIIIIYLGFISLGLPDQLLGVSWPDIRRTFDQPLAAAGLIVFIVTICTALASFSSGFFIKRYSVARILIVSSGLTILGVLGLALSPAWWLFVLWAIPLGFGGGTIDSVLNYYVATHYSAKHMNWLHGCWGIGATLGPGIITTALAWQNNWRVGYLLVVLVQALLFFLFLSTQHLWGDDKGQVQAQEHARAVRFWSLPVVFSCFFFFIYTGIEASVGLWFYSVLVEQHLLTKALAGSYIVLYWGSLTVGRFLIGILSQRVGPSKIISAGLLLAFSAVVLLLPAHGILTPLGLILLGVSLAGIYPCMMYETPRRFSKQVANVLTGYQVGMAGLGVASIPGLIGLFISFTSLDFFLPSILLLLSLLLIIDRQLHRLLKNV